MGPHRRWSSSPRRRDTAPRPAWKRAESLQLVDAAARAQQHPATFAIPSAEERDAVAVGNLVKLIWEEHPSGRGERMWVEVTAVNGDRLTGRLDNEPIELEGLLVADQVVEFGREHITQIWDG